MKGRDSIAESKIQNLPSLSNVNLALDEFPARQPSGTVEQGVLPDSALPHLRNFKLDNDKEMNLFPAIASGAGVALPSLKSINPS